MAQPQMQKGVQLFFVETDSNVKVQHTAIMIHSWARCCISYLYGFAYALSGCLSLQRFSCSGHIWMAWSWSVSTSAVWVYLCDRTPCHIRCGSWMDKWRRDGPVSGSGCVSSISLDVQTLCHMIHKWSSSPRCVRLHRIKWSKINILFPSQSIMENFTCHLRKLVLFLNNISKIIMLLRLPSLWFFISRAVLKARLQTSHMWFFSPWTTRCLCKLALLTRTLPQLSHG